MEYTDISLWPKPCIFNHWQHCFKQLSTTFNHCTYILTLNHYQSMRSNLTTTFNQSEASLQPLLTKPYLHAHCLQIIASKPIRSLYCRTSTAIGWQALYDKVITTGQTDRMTDTTTSKACISQAIKELSESVCQQIFYILEFEKWWSRTKDNFVGKQEREHFPIAALTYNFKMKINSNDTEWSRALTWSQHQVKG